MSGRAGHNSARQAGSGQHQTGQVRAGEGRKVLGRTGRRHEVSALGQCRTGLRKSWQDFAWSAEPDRDGKGSVKSAGPGWVGHGRLRQNRAWRGTGQGKAGLGRTW